MRPGLFISLALLGLAAIDPIGIAAMPILLIQKRPYVRSCAFLGGSFISLMVMGLLFARGCGLLVLHFENTHRWLMPSVELLAGLLLLGIAAVVFWQLKSGRLSTEPSTGLKRRLTFSTWQLFVFGMALVAVQSLVDVVFVIAMIRIGQVHLSMFTLSAAVATYAITALALQLTVVAAYSLTPARQRQHTLDSVHKLLRHYANQAIIGVSLLLGTGLFVNGALALSGAPHLT